MDTPTFTYTHWSFLGLVYILILYVCFCSDLNNVPDECLIVLLVSNMIPDMQAVVAHVAFERCVGRGAPVDNGN